METYATDEERVEALKKWWKENAKSLFAGLALGLSILFGWQAWQESRNSEADSASNAYTMLMASIERNEYDKAQQQSAEVVGQFSDSPYAVLTAMAMAKVKVEQDDLLGARTQLQWALEHSAMEEMKQLIRLRLARVMLAQGETDNALSQLTGVDAGALLAAYEELMGDIYMQQGKPKLAYESYISSMSKLDINSQKRSLLQLKLDDLAGVNAEQESAS